MTWLPSAELLRENKRMLDKAIRELDRERMGLQNQEKKIVGEIKKMAKQGQMVSDLQRAAILSQLSPALHLSRLAQSLCCGAGCCQSDGKVTRT